MEQGRCLQPICAGSQQQLQGAPPEPALLGFPAVEEWERLFLQPRAGLAPSTRGVPRAPSTHQQRDWGCWSTAQTIDCSALSKEQTFHFVCSFGSQFLLQSALNFPAVAAHFKPEDQI